MKNIVTMTATVACTLALIACGGGGGNSSGSTSNTGGSSNTLSRADEGIWNNLDNGSQYGMQSVILSDGSYWGLYGLVQNGTFDPAGVLQGTASVNGNSVSGSYTDYLMSGFVNGTYSGTVSAQHSLNLTFNEPSNTILSDPAVSGGNMSYDGLYNQPASLAAIAGSYGGWSCVINPGGVSYSCEGVVNMPIMPADSPPAVGSSSAATSLNMTISGSNLTVGDKGNGVEMISGTLAPHGTAVNVFDVNLTSGTGNDANVLPAGRAYKGILFQTSDSPGYTEIIATSGTSAFYYIGIKQN
jgi:hypothetical protein